MKTLVIVCMAVTLTLHSLMAQAESTDVAAPPMQVMGVITDYDKTSEIISLTPKGAVAAQPYRYTASTVMVDESGQPLLATAIKKGTVATFFYRMDKETMVLGRIIVHSVPLEEASPTPAT